MGRRYSMSGKRRVDVVRAQTPTEQRCRAAGKYIEKIQSDTVGMECVLAHDAALLDRLLYDGFLGEGQEAQWRFEAGNQLHRLHSAAGLGAPGAADLARAPDGAASSPRDVTPAQSRAFAFYTQTMRALGPAHGPRCRDVACYGVWTAGMTPTQLFVAFDTLATLLD